MDALSETRWSRITCARAWTLRGVQSSGTLTPAMPQLSNRPAATQTQISAVSQDSATTIMHLGEVIRMVLGVYGPFLLRRLIPRRRGLLDPPFISRTWDSRLCITEGQEEACQGTKRMNV